MLSLLFLVGLTTLGQPLLSEGAQPYPCQGIAPYFNAAFTVASIWSGERPLAARSVFTSVA